MADRDDMVDMGDDRGSPDHSPHGPSTSRARFLSVWFRCCHTYGRMYRNKDETAYEGRCPKCGAAVHALIGAHGTTQRTFIAE